MFRLHLTSQPLTDYRSAVRLGNKEAMGQLHLELLGEGFWISREGLGCLSTPMTRKEIDRFVAGLEVAFSRLLKTYPQIKIN